MLTDVSIPLVTRPLASFLKPLHATLRFRNTILHLNSQRCNVRVFRRLDSMFCCFES